MICAAVGVTSSTSVVTAGFGGIGGPMVVFPDTSKPLRDLTPTLVHAMYRPLGLMGLTIRAVSSVIVPGIHVSAAPRLIRIVPITHPQ